MIEIFKHIHFQWFDVLFILFATFFVVFIVARDVTIPELIRDVTGKKPRNKKKM